MPMVLTGHRVSAEQSGVEQPAAEQVEEGVHVTPERGGGGSAGDQRGRGQGGRDGGGRRLRRDKKMGRDLPGQVKGEK